VLSGAGGRRGTAGEAGGPTPAGTLVAPTLADLVLA
jgi:hypothetical protein